MSRAFVAIGSNMGERLNNCIEAARRLEAIDGIDSLNLSSAYETEPVGKTDQPDFINMVAVIDCTLSPFELLDACLAVERRMGRVRRERFGPRIIDLDVLLLDDLVEHSERLTLPHARLHQRRFVLEPLAELAPGARHPLLLKTAAQLLSSLPLDGQAVRRLDEQHAGIDMNVNSA